MRDPEKGATQLLLKQQHTHTKQKKGTLNYPKKKKKIHLVSHCVATLKRKCIKRPRSTSLGTPSTVLHTRLLNNLKRLLYSLEAKGQKCFQGFQICYWESFLAGSTRVHTNTHPHTHTPVFSTGFLSPRGLERGAYSLNTAILALIMEVTMEFYNELIRYFKKSVHFCCVSAKYYALARHRHTKKGVKQNTGYERRNNATVLLRACKRD